MYRCPRATVCQAFCRVHRWVISRHHVFLLLATSLFALSTAEPAIAAAAVATAAASAELFSLVLGPREHSTATYHTVVLISGFVFVATVWWRRVLGGEDSVTMTRMPYLVERAMVTVLRACIHMFDREDMGVSEDVTIFDFHGGSQLLYSRSISTPESKHAGSAQDRTVDANNVLVVAAILCAALFRGTYRCTAWYHAKRGRASRVFVFIFGRRGSSSNRSP